MHLNIQRHHTTPQGNLYSTLCTQITHVAYNQFHKYLIHPWPLFHMLRNKQTKDHEKLCCTLNYALITFPPVWLRWGKTGYQKKVRLNTLRHHTTPQGNLYSTLCTQITHVAYHQFHKYLIHLWPLFHMLRNKQTKDHEKLCCILNYALRTDEVRQDTKLMVIINTPRHPWHPWITF